MEFTLNKIKENIGSISQNGYRITILTLFMAPKNWFKRLRNFYIQDKISFTKIQKIRMENCDNFSGFKKLFTRFENLYIYKLRDHSKKCKKLGEKFATTFLSPKSYLKDLRTFIYKIVRT